MLKHDDVTIEGDGTFPTLDNGDPFWIIIAIAVLVKVLVGNQTTRSHKP